MAQTPDFPRTCFSALAAIVLLAAAALVAQPAHAASQTRSPAACATGGGTGNAWGTPNNAASSNNTDTTVSVDGDVSEALQCTSYGFTIPADATILGIEVNVERASSSTANGGSRDSSLTLLGGTLAGSNLATATIYTAADVVEAHGGATETWGNTWTVTQINATAFGAALQVTKPSGTGAAHTVNVDHMPVTVYYSSPPSVPSLVAPVDGTSIATATPQFDWTDVTDPDGDTFTYEVQADNSGCAFPSPEVNATGLVLSAYTSGALAGGTYCWRARAVDSLGVASAWSTTRNVTISFTPQSQTRSPTACATGGAGTAWSNPGNAVSSNNVDATVSVDGTTSQALQCTSYGFAIPAEAAIVGVEVNVERASSSTANGGSRDSSLTLLGGTLAGSNLATATTYTTADVIEAHGGAAETWGNAWTVTQINATAFGAALQVTKPSGTGAAHTVSVDHMPVTVYYTLPAPTLVSANADCGSTNQVKVRFSIPVTSASAQNTANYSLNAGASITAAVLDSSAQVVTLTTSGMTGGQVYALTVSNIVAVSGGTISPGSQITFFTELGSNEAGLVGLYYDQNGVSGQFFTGASAERIDAPVNFDWAAGAPIAGIGADNFSVIWEGFITPTTGGSYTFGTRTDDGVRLYINGALVIDNWTDHSATDNTSAATTLVAGQQYAVRMEFYERGGEAVAQLRWTGPSTGGTVAIPAANLSHCGAPRTAPRAFYRLDEVGWNGTAGEVKDSSGNGNDGTAAGGAVPIAARVCNGASLDGTSRYINVPGLSTMLSSTASMAFWIRTTQTGNDSAWQAPAVSGVELNGGTNDIFWGWIDASGRIGVAVGDTNTTKSTAAINNGAWHHVVLTRDATAGAFKIYIDGALNTSGAIATGTITTAFASLGRSEVSGGGTPRYINGTLDEVRIYDRVLTDADVTDIYGITRQCAGPDHYAMSGSTSGVTCDATVIQITAHDLNHTAVSPAAGTTLTLSTSTTSGVWMTGLISGTGGWTPSGANNGAATYVWPGGETSFSVRVRHNTAASVNINLLDNGSRTENPTEDLTVTFADSALRVSNAAGTAAVNIGTQLSAKNSNVGFGAQALYLQAIRTDTATGSCVGLIQGQTVTIEMAAARVNPTGSSSQVSVQNSSGTMVALGTGAGVAGGYTNVSLTFDANSVAPLILNYPNAGTVTLFAQYQLPSPPAAAYVSGSSNTFVVRPFALRISGPTPIGATGPTSAVYAKAGATWPQTVTVAAVVWEAADDVTIVDGVPDTDAVLAGNAITTNFGAESTAATVALTHTLAAPSGGVTGTLTTSLSAFTNGQATTSASFSEVGIIDLFATSANYLGTSQSVRNSTAGYAGVGRFYPDHFFVSTVPTITNRSASSCAPASAFTYMSENFALGSFTLQARNTAGAVTQNYTTSSSFAKLNPTSATQMGLAALSGSTDLSGRLTSTLSGSFTSGAASITATLSLQRNSAGPDGPFPTLQIGIAPNDGDTTAVTLRTSDLDMDVVTPVGADHKLLASTDIRFGRLRIQNAIGSAQLDLPITLRAEYYNGTGFVTNAADGCTTLQRTDIRFDFVTASPRLSACDTITNPTGTISFSAGVAGSSLRLTKPVSQREGAVDLTVNLNGAGGTSCTATGTTTVAATNAARPYLQGAWTGSTYAENPRARFTFGAYKGAEEFIYLQENF